MKALLAFVLIVLHSCKGGGYESSLADTDNGACSPILNELNALISQRNSYEMDLDQNAQKFDNFALTEGEVEAEEPLTEVHNQNDANNSGHVDNKIKSPFSDLEQRIALKQQEYLECQQKKYGQSALPKPESGNQGHCDFSGQNYDILNYNCHSAANESVTDDPENTGIISCGGDAPSMGSPAHHTFNYRIEGKTIVYYNWGRTCRAPLHSVPPSLEDPDHHECAVVFCGDQYNENTTKPLAIGETVEEPGPLYCSYTNSTKESCDSCCRFRGTYWDKIGDNLRPTDLTFTQFMSQCYSACAKK